MKLKMIDRIMAVVVALTFFVNETAFALGTQPGANQSGTRADMNALGQKLFAAKVGPGAIDFDTYKSTGIQQFVGTPPEIDGFTPVTVDYEHLPQGWENNPILGKKDLIEAFKYFRDDKKGADIPEDLLDIQEGEFAWDERKGELPIACIETIDANGRKKYVLIIHTKFVQAWNNIRDNDRWFKVKLQSGEERIVSLAWGIFYRIAKHEMADLAKTSRAPKSFGHISSLWSETPQGNEFVANAIGGRYSQWNDAIWLWFLGSYAFADTTRYDNNMLEKRLQWFFEGKEALDLDLNQEFPNLMGAANFAKRSEAIKIAQLINYQFFSRQPEVVKLKSESSQESKTEDLVRKVASYFTDNFSEEDLSRKIESLHGSSIDIILGEVASRLEDYFSKAVACAILKRGGRVSIWDFDNISIENDRPYRLEPAAARVDLDSALDNKLRYLALSAMEAALDKDDSEFSRKIKSLSPHGLVVVPGGFRSERISLTDMRGIVQDISSLVYGRDIFSYIKWSEFKSRVIAEIKRQKFAEEHIDRKKNQVAPPMYMSGQDDEISRRDTLRIVHQHMMTGMTGIFTAKQVGVVIDTYVALRDGISHPDVYGPYTTLTAGYAFLPLLDSLVDTVDTGGNIAELRALLGQKVAEEETVRATKEAARIDTLRKEFQTMIAGMTGIFTAKQVGVVIDTYVALRDGISHPDVYGPYTTLTAGYAFLPLLDSLVDTVDTGGNIAELRALLGQKVAGERTEKSQAEPAPITISAAELREIVSQSIKEDGTIKPRETKKLLKLWDGIIRAQDENQSVDIEKVKTAIEDKIDKWDMGLILSTGIGVVAVGILSFFAGCFIPGLEANAKQLWAAAGFFLTILGGSGVASLIARSMLHYIDDDRDRLVIILEHLERSTTQPASAAAEGVTNTIPASELYKAVENTIIGDGAIDAGEKDKILELWRQIIRTYGGGKDVNIKDVKEIIENKIKKWNMALALFSKTASITAGILFIVIGIFYPDLETNSRTLWELGGVLLVMLGGSGVSNLLGKSVLYYFQDNHDRLEMIYGYVECVETPIAGRGAEIKTASAGADETIPDPSAISLIALRKELAKAVEEDPDIKETREKRHILSSWNNFIRNYPVEGSVVNIRDLNNAMTAKINKYEMNSVKSAVIVSVVSVIAGIGFVLFGAFFPGLGVNTRTAWEIFGLVAILGSATGFPAIFTISIFHSFVIDLPELSKIAIYLTKIEVDLTKQRAEQNGVLEPKAEDLDTAATQSEAEHPLVRIISEYIVKIGNGVGPGVLEQEMITAIWESVNLLDKNEIEIILPLKPTHTIDKALRDMKKGRGHVTCERYNSLKSLKEVLAVPAGNKKRIVVVNSKNAGMADLLEHLDEATQLLFKGVRIMNVELPDSYFYGDGNGKEIMDDKDKTIYEAKLITRAILLRLYEKDSNLAVKAVLQGLLEGELGECPSVDDYLNSIVEPEDEGTGQILARIKASLGKIVSLVRLKGLELMMMKELWKYA